MGDTDITEILSLPEDADHAILQQPLNVGVRNVKQILKCIKSGSREVKDVILNECNIIYECKVCQSLFRSLANLLYHKRGFCKKHLCEDMLLFETFDETETIVVEPTEPEPNKVNDAERPSDDNIQNNGMSSDEIKASVQEPSGKSDTSKTSEEEVVMENVDAIVEAIVDVEATDNDAEKSDKTRKEAEIATEICPKATGAETSSKEVEMTEIKITPPIIPRIKVSRRKNVSRKYTGEKKASDSSEEDTKIKKYDSEISTSPAKPKSVDTEKKNEKEIVPVILRPIAGNKNAVFQVVKNSASNVTVTQSEPSSKSIIYNGSDDKEKIITVIPKINKEPSLTTTSSNLTIPKDIHLSRRNRLLNRTDCCVHSLECKTCNTAFATVKTLYFHMMSFHSKKRMYFPCPYCKLLFIQMYGVTRHIIQAHGKTKEQINNKLRDSIRKGAVWKRVDSVEARDAFSLIEKEIDLKVNDTDKDSECLKSDTKLPQSFVRIENNSILHHCSKCGRVFSRKSSQVSHEKFCIRNPSPTKTEEGYSKPRLTNDVTRVPVIIEEKKNPFEIRLSSRPKRGAEKQMHKDFVDSQTLKWRSVYKIETPKIAPNIPVIKPPPSKAHEKKILSLVNSEKLLCLKCNRKFSSFSNLRRHAAIHIGWTRYRCKACDYQSYNKSDCIHHIERVHTSIPKNDLEKHVISLGCESFRRKAPPMKIVKSPSIDSEQSIPKKKKKHVKKSVSPQKKSLSSRKRKLSSEVKPASPPKKSVNDITTEIVYKEHLVVKKNDKKPQPINYRSLTTSSPTTIILSKTLSGSTVQITKNTAPIPIYNRICANNKAMSTRNSPRKKEPTIQLLKNVNIAGQLTTASLDPKTNVVKIRLPFQVANQLSNEKKLEITEEGTSSKRGRPISDWFVKKEHSHHESSNRRDSAPVIIDLVRASSSIVPRPKTSLPK